MARTHGRIKVEVWDVGSDYRRLSIEAQWAYQMLVSQPGVTMCGTLPYAPKKWAKLASGLSIERLEAAIAELEEQWFLIVDRETDELLIRTFVKHDAPWRLPNLVIRARRQFQEIESDVIRGYLGNRHEWMTDESIDAEKVKDMEEQRASERASERTLAMDVGNGHSEHALAMPRVRAQPSPAPTPAPEGKTTSDAAADSKTASASTELKDEGKETEESAAAGEADDLAAAIQALPGFDERSWTSIGPLVETVGVESAAEVLAEVKRRRKVENPVGLLKELLEIRRRELVRQQVEQSISPPEPTRLQKLEADPEAYVREVGWKLPDDALDEKLAALLPEDQGRRFELANLAADLRRAAPA